LSSPFFFLAKISGSTDARSICSVANLLVAIVNENITAPCEAGLQ